MSPPRPRACTFAAFAAVGAVTVMAAVAACSSASSKGARGPDASTDGAAEAGADAASDAAADVGLDAILDPENCVPPGTPNNEAGIGGYCSPGGGQCGADTLCTADFGAPAHAWFCTNLCNDGGVANCGSPGPACVTVEGESVCLPESCLVLLADGGLGSNTGDTTETLDVDGGTRTYILHTPPGYTGQTPVPLVFDFHPLGVPAAVWKGVSTWAAEADKDGFIVVWPQGIDDAWNVGRCCGGADDVAFTRAMIAAISAEKSIDPKRIYATGCSNGGGMSYMLACNAADVIAAVAPVNFDCITGATNDPSCGSCTPSRPVSEVQFMGTADTEVPYDGGPTPVVQGLLFPSAQANFTTWGGFDQCTGTPAAAPSQPSCQSYASCGASTQVTLCTIDQGTHCGSYGTYPITQIAWQTFQSESLP
ncbi:MAG TPA: PHB depolymerase family esterase [Polyangiaceae bacterium]